MTAGVLPVTSIRENKLPIGSHDGTNFHSSHEKDVLKNFDSGILAKLQVISCRMVSLSEEFFQTISQFL
uniref:Ovule protein n=1 Tax=Haemonchus contortus TaxID=6289 RepID=A0A7I4Y4G8_HAECO